MSTTDKSSLYNDLKEFFGRKAEEAEEGDDGETTDEQTGKKQGDDSGQKQPDPDAQDVEEDLIAALAEHKNVDPNVLREAIDQAADRPEDEEDEMDDEDEEEDEVDQNTEDDNSGTVNIDFGSKLEEHGVVTEDELGEKMDEFRESIVEDLGQKLAESNEEAVEEIAQKMQSSTTPSPAGGSFQDAQDFESHLEEITSGDDWT